MERETRLFEFMCGYAEKAFAGLPDEELCRQPAPGVNHPAWIIGHLCVCNDYSLGLLGKTPLCNEEWHDQFGAGSVPTSDRDAYPAKAALLARFREGRQAVKEAAAAASLELLERPNPLDLDVLEGLPSLGDLVAHLMTTHFSLHLGQLSAWRRSIGMPPAL